MVDSSHIASMRRNHYPLALFQHSRLTTRHIVVVALVLAAIQVQAEVKLPSLFSDHMVLQEGAPVPVWGWAKPGEKISLSVGNQIRAATADGNGRWSVSLDPLKSGLHLTMIVLGENKIEIHDVLTGEVWLGSGQSNMGLKVKESQNADAEKATANFPQIRMFTVDHKSSPEPLDDCSGRWEVCGADSVPNFSAVMYFFGRELHQKLQSPVGIIHSSWGGTPIQSWIPLQLQMESPGCDKLLEEKRRKFEEWPAKKKIFDEQMKEWEKGAAAAKAEHKPMPPKPWNPGPPNFGQYVPAQLYNAMIHPLIPYGLRGAIWYQGEANAGGGPHGATVYSDLLGRLIRSWRAEWKQGNFPVLFVQLPNFKCAPDASHESWAFFREAQAKVLSVTNTAMAVTIDIGEGNNIHPKNKQEAGRRLALLALAQVYQQPVTCHGPEFSQIQINGPEARVKVSNADGGLKAKDEPVRGFTIAGADNTFRSASARIEGSDVVVSCPKVPAPVSVRYDWGNDPDGNVYNGAGLPMAPFRTDR